MHVFGIQMCCGVRGIAKKCLAALHVHYVMGQPTLHVLSLILGYSAAALYWTALKGVRCCLYVVCLSVTSWYRF